MEYNGTTYQLHNYHGITMESCMIYIYIYIYVVINGVANGIKSWLISFTDIYIYICIYIQYMDVAESDVFSPIYCHDFLG